MRRKNNTYYFSVEGQCEKHYLNHLSSLINHDEGRTCNVSFIIKVTNSPKSFVKGITTVKALELHHIVDIESLDEYHIEDFKKQLSEMSSVKINMKPRVKSYSLGYTNFTFELWMILHKKNCFAKFSHRNDYLSEINKAYNKQYKSIEEFKNQKEFQNIINDLTLVDVKEAIKRSITIISNLKEDESPTQQYKGYKYYNVSPSLSLHDIIIKILEEAGINF